MSDVAGFKRRDRPQTAGERHVRELLRGLRDPGALRRNPLAIALLASSPAKRAGTNADEIAGWVRRGADLLATSPARYAAERREIVVRCDLAGESHKVVMASLGFASRAFYYERRAALGELAGILAGLAARERPSDAAALDDAQVRLRGALALHEAGESYLALRTLQRLSSEASTHAQAVCAAAHAASLTADLGSATRALLAFGEAARLALDLPAENDPPTLVAQIELRIAGALVSLHTGRGPQGMHALEETVARVRGLPLLANEVVREVYVRALLTVAEYRVLDGSLEHASSLLAEAAAVLELVRDPPPRLRANLSIVKSEISLMHERPLSDAEGFASEALRIAERHGLLYVAVGAGNGLCAIAAMRGRAADAVTVGRASARLGANLVSSSELDQLHLNIARAETGAGNFTAAASLIAKVPGEEGGSWLVAVFRDMTRVGLHLALGRYASAAELSGAVVLQLGRSGAKHLLGSAFSFQARALYGLGRVPEAREAIDAAVALTERHGSRHAVAEVYDLAGALAADRRRARQARELFRLLGTERAGASI